MRVRRDIVVQAIINNQKSFFKILDYINEHSGVLEVPDSFYLKLYTKEIFTESETRGDHNAQSYLNIESLVENGIFVYHNKNTGMLALDNAIFELLKFIDVARARELNSEDFELLRGSIELSVNNIMIHDVGSEKYNDAMKAFYVSMNETLSKIRANVEKLVAKVDEIAVEFKLFENAGKVSPIELYEKVVFLYQRYVLPCYEFISPSIQLISKKSFSQAVDELIEFHQESGELTIANTISFNKTAITSYFKDVSELEAKLKQYSNHLESDRNFFISIENAYSALMDSVFTLRHGKQKSFMLSHSDAFFDNYSCMDGLSSHSSKFEPLLNWNIDKTPKRFKEYLRFIEAQEFKYTPHNKLKPLPQEIDIDEERKIVIAKHVSSLCLGDDKFDIHKYLQNELQIRLDDFSLVDALFGLECVHDLYDEQIKSVSYERNRIEDDIYFFEYLPISLLESENV